MAKLILMTGPGQTKQINLRKHETRLGRASTNDIVIDMDRVSRAHARIVVQDDFASITDLDSRNGTSVNGVRVVTQVLANGDTIRIGDCEIRFLTGDEVRSDADALRLMTEPGSLQELDGRDRVQTSAKR